LGQARNETQSKSQKPKNKKEITSRKILTWRRIWVMAHLKPDKTAASIIKINPHRLNSVAFATENFTIWSEANNTDSERDRESSYDSHCWVFGKRERAAYTWQQNSNWNDKHDSKELNTWLFQPLKTKSEDYIYWY
jgi:hypothetical protein